MTTDLINYIKRSSHIIILFILLSLSVNSYNYAFIELVFYVLLHILFIFYSFYDDYKLNIIIVFIIGFMLDLFLINEFGPHLFSFLFFYLIVNQLKKFFISQNAKLLILLNLFLMILILISEKILVYIVYGLKFDYYILLQCIILSIILCYPVYLILNILKEKIK